MFIEGGLIATVVAAGAAIDRYTTEKAKRSAGSWIAQAPRFDWHNFVAERSWFIYTRVFGAHSASWRFLITSTLAYSLVCAGSFVFLYLFFPSTYYSITSAWVFGDALSRLWWVIALLGGDALYILANAQTLYFLEILKTAPNLFKFLLVAYADFLITASVSLFGIPALLTVHTFGITHGESFTLAAKIDFSDLKTPTTSEIVAKYGATRKTATPAHRSHNSYTIRYSFLDASVGVPAREADFQAIKQAIRLGEVSGEVLRGGEEVSVRNADGGLIGTQQSGKPFEGEAYVYNFDNVISDTYFCRAFVAGVKREVGTFALWSITATDIRRIYSACRAGETVSFTIPAEVRATNIRWGRVYNRYILTTLAEMTMSVGSGFRSYLTLSPYSVLGENNLYEVWKKPTGDTPQLNSERAFDRITYDLLTFQSGSRNMVFHQGVPAGSVNVAIMSTAIFNLLVMSIFFIAYPLVKLASRYEIITRYIDFEESPFTVLAVIIGTWLGMLIVVVDIVN